MNLIIKYIKSNLVYISIGLVGVLLFMFLIAPLINRKANTYRDSIIEAVEYQNTKKEIEQLTSELTSIRRGFSKNIRDLKNEVQVSNQIINRLRYENTILRKSRDSLFNNIDSLDNNQLKDKLSERFNQVYIRPR